MSIANEERSEQVKGEILLNSEDLKKIEELSSCYKVDYNFFLEKIENENSVSLEDYVDYCLKAVSCQDLKKEKDMLKKIPSNRQDYFLLLAKLNSKGEVFLGPDCNEVKFLSLAEMIFSVYPTLLEELKGNEEKDSIKSMSRSLRYSFLLMTFLVSCMYKNITTVVEKENASSGIKSPIHEVSINGYPLLDSIEVVNPVTGSSSSLIDFGDFIHREESLDMSIESSEKEEIMDGVELKDERSHDITDKFQEIRMQEKIDFFVNHEVFQGDTDRRIVIMTYDDGGSVENMLSLMDVYDSYGFKTTFFVTGEWVQANLELTKSIIERGFEIGCHGWDHQEMQNLGRDGTRKQFEAFLEIMKEVDPSYQVKFVRFPFGSRNESLREVAAELGMQSIMWSVESGGMDERTFSYVTDRVDSGSIVLSHSTRWYDVSQSAKILERLKELGFSVTTVGEGLSDEDKFPSD